MRPSKTLLGTLLITSAMGLTLAGCDRKPQALATADTALPATAALPTPGPVQDRYGPPPKRIPVGRVVNNRDDWAWAERSYALDNAFYDTAPDYGFDYEDDQPWVWQTDDRWAMYGDPYDYGYDWDDDGYYYYYQPGAVRPYFIRDANYGYGFDDVGRLVIIYDLLGRIMPQSFLYEREPYVSRYYQRAYQVRQASLRVQPIVITQEVWQTRAPVIDRYQSRWINSARTQPQWVDYRQRTGDRYVRAFSDDRRERQQRTFAANGAPQRNSGLIANTLDRGRTQPTQAAQADQNRRGFFGFGGNRQRQEAAQPQLAQIDRNGGRDRQRQDRAGQLQANSQAQVDQNRRGFFGGKGPDRQAADQAQQRQVQAREQNGRQRQEIARQQQAEQAQAADQSRHGNGRERQQLARQQQAQQNQAQAQDRENRGRQLQEATRQQQAQQGQAEARARQEQGRRQQAQQRQAEAQARQQQQAQQRQAEAQARQEQGRQQQAQQRQAEAQVRQQQQAQQRQAEAQARQQQQAQQRQAEAQARQEQGRQQQMQQRQAEAQARQQQQAQQRQAEAQARQEQGRQQQAQQRQAEAQARQQQQAQHAQARQQQAQAQQAQQAEARAQQAQARQQQQQAQQPQAADANANTNTNQGGGRGHGKKN